MIISKELYEEMQNKITELTAILGFLLVGKQIIIPDEEMQRYGEAFQGYSVIVARGEGFIQILLGKPDEKSQ